MTSSDQQRVTENHANQRNFQEILSNYVIMTVPADGLAPLGARPSADTVMTKFSSCIYTGPALQEFV